MDVERPPTDVPSLRDHCGVAQSSKGGQTLGYLQQGGWTAAAAMANDVGRPASRPHQAYA